MIGEGSHPRLSSRAPTHETNATLIQRNNQRNTNLTTTKPMYTFFHSIKDILVGIGQMAKSKFHKIHFFGSGGYLPNVNQAAEVR